MNLKCVLCTVITGSKFLVEGVATDFRYVKCKSTPDPSVQRVGQCHRNQHELHAIGFQVSAGFIRLMETCYDARLYNTLYVRFNLMKGAENRQRNVPRLSYFRKSTHFRNIQPPIEKVYNCVKGQYAVFINLLGSPQLAARYILHYLLCCYIVIKSWLLLYLKLCITFLYIALKIVLHVTLRIREERKLKITRASDRPCN